MREIPSIPDNRFKFGIKPLLQSELLIKDYTIYGFDTETLPFSYLNYSVTWRNDKGKLINIFPKDLINYTDLFSIQLTNSRENAFYFANFKTGIKWLNLFDKRSIIFAYNLPFDLGALLGKDYLTFEKGQQLNIPNSDIWLKGKITEGIMNFAHFQFFKYENEKRKIIKDLKFIDLANFLVLGKKITLDALAKQHFPNNPELWKLEKPEYLGKRLPKKEELEYFQKYAIQDANICFLLGKKIINNFFVPQKIRLTYTIASFYASIFRKSFLKKSIVLPKQEYIPLIWETYNGGRFESFGRGFFEKINVLDVNSLYPYSASFPLPFEHSDFFSLNNLETYEKNKTNVVGFAKIKFKFPENTMYPNCPVKTSKLFFPLQGISYLTTYELEEALKQNAEIEILDFLGFFPSKSEIDHPLKEFVEKFYSEKVKLDEISLTRPLTDKEKEERQFFKIGLNSVYGKFAEKHKNAQTLKAGKMFHPAIASLITGKARAILSQYIREYNSIYSDTDSIITTKKIKKKHTGTELGKLKTELKNGNVVIIRPKIYKAWNDSTTKYAIHSFRKFDTLNSAIAEKKPIKQIEYKHIKFTKPKESEKRHILPRAIIPQFFTINFKEDNKRIYKTKLENLKLLTEKNTLSIPLKEVTDYDKFYP